MILQKMKMMKSKMEMSENELNLLREKIEEEFNSMMENGESLRSFLYVPYNFLTPKIMRYLDEYLMEEAYKSLEEGTLTIENFLVYRDQLITVRLDTDEKRITLLEKMIEHFKKNEEYEKCSKALNLLNLIKSGTQHE